MRLRVGTSAMGNPLEPQHEEKGEEADWYLHESRSIVGTTKID